jgi:hypothetical protein
MVNSSKLFNKLFSNIAHSYLGKMLPAAFMLPVQLTAQLCYDLATNIHFFSTAASTTSLSRRSLDLGIVEQNTFA